MGRSPCCDKATVKRGPWSPEEDAVLKNYINKFGTGDNWISLPRKAGLNRCGKSCRLRWLNYLRPDIKHGGFTDEEDDIIWRLYHKLGRRWSVIASHLRGRTDNDVKNYWNTKLKKKLMTREQQNPSAAATPLPPLHKAESIGEQGNNYAHPRPLFSVSASEEISVVSSSTVTESWNSAVAGGAIGEDDMLFLSELDLAFLSELLDGGDGGEEKPGEAFPPPAHSFWAASGTVTRSQ